MAERPEAAATAKARFVELFVRLLDDVADLSEPSGTAPPVRRRSYVRAVFAFVEGTTFAAKQLALEGGSAHLSLAEQVMLREHDFLLDDRGRAKTRQARLSSVANIRFAFAMLAKSRQVHYQPRYGGEGWASMKKAIGIRDRVMHPKAVSDLVVSDEELASVAVACRWYIASMTLCLKSIVEALNESVASLREALEPTDSAWLAELSQRYGPHAE